MKVKIVRCHSFRRWYFNEIGQTFEVEPYDNERYKVVGSPRCVFIADAEQVKAPTRKNLKLELRVKGLELTVKVLEQDEVDTCKSGSSVLMFQSSDYFVITSDCKVEIAPFGELFIKGVESGDSYSNEFKSQDKLNTYITRLKQAVKEFNAAGGFAKTTKETVEIIE